MEFDHSVQSNCSESVSQICGVTKESIPEFRKILEEELSFKYKDEYLKEYLDSILFCEGKYLLNLREDLDDLDEFIYAAGKVGASFDCVSSCSSYIESDESMESHLRNKNED